MSIQIRRAAEADCKSIMNLIQELADYEKAPDEVTVDFDHFVKSGFGENPVWYAFVAVENDLVIGFALYYIRSSTWKGQRMYLEDILVTNSHRGKGVGKLLFDQLIKEAGEKKLSGMVWQVLDWNKLAIQFYQKKKAELDSTWINGRLYFGQGLNRDIFRLKIIS